MEYTDIDFEFMDNKDYYNLTETCTIRMSEIFMLQTYVFFYFLMTFCFVTYKYTSLEKLFNELNEKYLKLESKYRDICHTEFSSSSEESSEKSSEESSDETLEESSEDRKEYEIDNHDYVFSNIGYDN